MKRSSLFLHISKFKRKRNRSYYFNQFLFLFYLLYFYIQPLRFEIKIQPTKNKFLYEFGTDLFGNLSWLDDFNIVRSLQDVKYENCSVCKYKYWSPHSDSTSKDLIIGSLYGSSHYNLINWVRTLRSANSKCSIGLLATQRYIDQLDPNELIELEKCGAKWIIFEKDTHPKWKDLILTRIVLFANFVENFGHYFDRIIINDIFDTIFLLDPFQDSFDRSHITMSIERVKFKHHIWNDYWVKIADRTYDKPFYEEKWIVNGGFFYATRNLMLKLLNNMIDMDIWQRSNANDQGILNYKYYRDFVPEIIPDIKGEIFISACYSVFEQYPDEKGLMHEIGLPYTPAMIHQYDRICPISRYLGEICPALGDWHVNATGRPTNVMQQCGSSRTKNTPST